MAILVEQRHMTLRDLAERIAAEPNDVSERDPGTLELVLHHNHLPRLDDELYVEYDPRAGDVILWEDPQTVSRRLRNYD